MLSSWRRNDGEKSVNCPLREIPEKMEIDGKCPQPGQLPSYRIGWNDCIDKILRQKLTFKSGG